MENMKGFYSPQNICFQVPMSPAMLNIAALNIKCAGQIAATTMSPDMIKLHK